MASSGGNSPRSTTTIAAGLQASVSEGGDLGRLLDQRKRRRMESNRESARRSRMRKQMHLDELATAATRLTSENARLSARIAVMSRQLMAVEAENSVLRAQLMELSHQLESLDNIVRWVEPGSVPEPDRYGNSQEWNPVWQNQPIAAAAAFQDIFRY
ncbi:hypothetical protein MLD38_001810 [Melastoma candidum]|uniref:Uncharacterized protein n=1 Tax=Melastoma candidum TaxID=119954 RepID=A0ACB9SHQ8_9MYRT|nr:hypothetical protein MLD38_001810 [Melastoma candidum]